MKKFALGFAAVFVIVVLLIVIAGQHIPFFDFGFKDWAIFCLVSIIILLVGAFWAEFHDFRLF